VKSLTQRSRTEESNLSVMLAVGRMFGHSAGYPAYDGPEGSKATQNRAKREDRMSAGRDPLLRGRTQKWLAPDPGCRGNADNDRGTAQHGRDFRGGVPNVGSAISIPSKRGSCRCLSSSRR
jgi:hypothetical protein